jgi:TMEM175 potassium channel family protein
VTSASRDTVLLVAFSDGVFAITLWPSYLAYAVTFLFIGQVWANHHVMFDHIRAADRIVLLLNTVLLMVVAFLPFATSVLAEALRSGHGQRTAVGFTASRST